MKKISKEEVLEPSEPGPGEGTESVEKVLFTIGHSTRELKEFVGILKANAIQRVVDVRTVPKSRRYPWFDREALAVSLRQDHIHYAHLASLGGLRPAREDSKNQGLKSGNFRGFADHMATKEFEQGLETLNQMLAVERVAVMCSEAVPWRCHRSLISDLETIRGVPVKHLMGADSVLPHVMTDSAVVDKGSRPQRVLYPAPPGGAVQEKLL